MRYRNARGGVPGPIAQIADARGGVPGPIDEVADACGGVPGPIAQVGADTVAAATIFLRPIALARTSKTSATTVKHLDMSPPERKLTRGDYR